MRQSLREEGKTKLNFIFCKLKSLSVYPFTDKKLYYWFVIYHADRKPTHKYNKNKNKHMYCDFDFLLARQYWRNNK